MSVARLRPWRRVVISGIGVVAPNGIGKDAFWRACLAGQAGIRRITRFDASPLPSQIAGEVADFEASQFGITPEEIHHSDRAIQFALACAQLALHDANILHTLSDDEREQTGVMLGSALAGLDTGEAYWSHMTRRGTEALCLESEGSLPNTLLLSHAAVSTVAAHYQLHGPCSVIATGCSAGADAIGQAYWTIQEGRAERMLAGGTDSSISYGVLDAFCVIGALSTKYNETPERASRPYDGLRDGFVMAEGAAIVLLEERDLALARGAHIYAEITAFASNINAHHMTSLPPSGAPLQHLLTQILDEAGIRPDEIGYINSHGSSTPTNEVAETKAYKGAFGEQAYKIPISSTKSMIGHAQGAASAIEAAVTALVLEQQAIPPTINQEQKDPQCDLDYVPNCARRAAIDVALTHSSGFGGVNSALLLARPDWMTNHDR